MPNLKDKISRGKAWTSELVGRIGSDEIFTQAAALAFYTVLSMAPLLILMVALLATLELDLKAELIVQLREVVGNEAADVIQTVIRGVQSTPDLSSARGWLGALALLVSASVVFAHLQKTLNVIFDVQPTHESGKGKLAAVKRLVARRILSFGMVLSFIFISIVSLVVSSAISFLSKEHGVWWSWPLNFAVNFMIFAALFSVIFKWIPDKNVKTSTGILSGILTAFLFIVGKELIGLYIGQTAVGSAYGAAGSLVILLVWVYYSSLIFFLGAEIASVTLMRDRRPLKKQEEAA